VHESASFRSVMATFPTGVGIVTTLDRDGRPWGMTCTSVCSITLVPPILLVSLRYGSPTLAAVLRRKAFAVNLLHCGAQSTAELFASGRPDRFDHVRWHWEPGLGGPELPDDAHAAVHCRVVSRQRVKDHVLVFGKVLSVCGPTGFVQPLLHGLRHYASWPEAGQCEGFAAQPTGLREPDERGRRQPPLTAPNGPSAAEDAGSRDCRAFDRAGSHPTGGAVRRGR
jgi:flavin reductase (NADH)